MSEHKRMKPGIAEATDELVKRCLADAAKRKGGDSNGYAVGLELYAKIMPGFSAWESEMRERGETSMADYVDGVMTVAIALATTALRTATNDDADMKNKLGPFLTAWFARGLQYGAFNAEVVKADTGKLDS